MATNTMDTKMNEATQCNQNTSSFEKMPGHWVLAKLGKRVLRPGGIQLTERMLGGLSINSGDHVVEFAPLYSIPHLDENRIQKAVEK